MDFEFEIIQPEPFEFEQDNLIVVEPEKEWANVKSTEEEQIVLPTGQKVFSRVIVEPIVLEEKSVEPATTEQIVQASENFDGLKQVVVEAVDSEIDNNIQADNIKQGVKILGVQGNLPEINNQNIIISTNGIYTADEGFTGLGEVEVGVFGADIDFMRYEDFLSYLQTGQTMPTVEEYEAQELRMGIYYQRIYEGERLRRWLQTV